MRALGRSGPLSPEVELGLMVVTLAALIALLLPTELGSLSLVAAVVMPATLLLALVWWFVHRRPVAGLRRSEWWHDYWAGCLALVSAVGVVRLIVDPQIDERLWYLCLVLGLGRLTGVELSHSRAR